MKSSKLIITFAVLSFTSCQNDEPTMNQREETVNTSQYEVPVEIAIDKANKLLEELDQDMMGGTTDDTNTQSRTLSQTRTIKEIQKIKNGPQGRTISDSQYDNGTLYLINYDDNRGFALMGGDTRLPSIYAISNEGQLNLADTLYNEGLAIVMQLIRNDISIKINGEKSRADVTDTNNTVIVTDSKVTPWLTSSEIKGWHQNTPYNKYCFTSNGSQALVGCVAVACTQIMAYHKWPTKVDGETFYWRSMIKGSDNDGVAKFMAKLGEPAYLNMNYGISASGAYDTDAAKTFTIMGYEHSGLINYNEDMILESLSDKAYPFGPIYIRGSRTNNTGTISGHAWIIDGFIKQAIYIDKTPSNGVDNADIFIGYAPTLMHCIWGWGGTCNGYYYVEAQNPEFDLTNGPVNSDGYLEGSGTMNRKYNIDLRIIVNIDKI